MSRFNKLILCSAAALLTVSCARTARIDAVVADAPSSEVIIKKLDINRFEILDTLALDQEGKFSYKVDVQKGHPEFVYIFRGDVKIASLILKAGDKVSIVADTTGRYTVDGSEESLKLADVERDYARALAKMTSLAQRIDEAVNEDYAASLRQQLAQEYVEYYRGRVKYIMSNSRSLSVVPVFFQNVSADLPVFAQSTDAIHFRNIADSLALEYPDSKYVKALRQEADRRFGFLELQSRISSADAVAYPDIELPDINGQKRKLSGLDAKVIMLQFWSAEDAAQKMYNLDVLKPLYDEFNTKGFEIYQVSLDVDKGLWAQVVKEQKLPWVSVCDSHGSASVHAMNYNLKVIPAFFLIANGELIDGNIVDEKTLRKIIKDNLK